jgi:hypothetical protein
VTAGEAQNPAVVQPRATNGVIFRILIFYARVAVRQLGGRDISPHRRRDALARPGYASSALPCTVLVRTTRRRLLAAQQGSSAMRSSRRRALGLAWIMRAYQAESDLKFKAVEARSNADAVWFRYATRHGNAADVVLASVLEAGEFQTASRNLARSRLNSSQRPPRSIGTALFRICS